MATSPDRPYPRRTLEQALRVARALREHNGGQAWPAGEIAKALDIGAKSGNFFYLTSASKQYGYTEGTSRSGGGEISLTELGRRAVYPDSPEVEREAHREAFLNIPSFRGVLEYYGGNNLPEPEYRENTMFTKFGLAPEVQEEFVEILNKNSRFVGIGGNDFAANGAGSATPASEAQAQTIARPAKSKDGAGDDAPVCFVIMPFVERSDRYPAAFFTEVLESIFTPAITNAGLQVRTAKRQGSDVIQSTIVKELLAADLVLADLTEHNPNVLFELGMRMANEKPVVLVRAKGTGAIFDVDHVLRVEEYSSNVWPSTVARDIPRLQAHIEAAWANRDSGDTYMRILQGPVAATAAA